MWGWEQKGHSISLKKSFITKKIMELRARNRIICNFKQIHPTFESLGTNGWFPKLCLCFLCNWIRHSPFFISTALLESAVPAGKLPTKGEGDPSPWLASIKHGFVKCFHPCIKERAIERFLLCKERSHWYQRNAPPQSSLEQLLQKPEIPALETINTCT